MTQPTHLSNHVVSDRLAPHKLSAVRSWAANRPGELQPATTPEGAYVGSPGPNQGFALTIARRLGHDAVLSTGEDLHDVEVGVAAIACRRAAMFGRAPSVYDVRHALGIFGYLDTAPSELVEVRRARFSGVGHSYPLVRALADIGMFGIDQFTAIINPPDACILAVGGIAQEPVVKGGQVVPGNVMNVTLSCDHRVVDGATGAAFLQTLKSLLEEPLRMLA